jgi:hypothetical protein
MRTTFSTRPGGPGMHVICITSHHKEAPFLEKKVKKQIGGIAYFFFELTKRTSRTNNNINLFPFCQ